MFATLIATALSAAVPTGTTITTINPGLIFNELAPAVWRCKKWNNTNCTAADRANPAMKQLVFFGAGFTDTAADRDLWWTTFEKNRDLMVNSAGTAWSQQKREQLLFIGYWTPGGALGEANAVFKAKIPPHPIRGLATSLDQDDVYAKVQQISAEISTLNPIGVGVIFNSVAPGVTANAAPPTVVGKKFGIGKWLRGDLDTRGAYLPVHELGHAAMNFLDEYIEGGFEDINITQLDVLTPLAMLDTSSWGNVLNAIANVFGVFDLRISEILANNGSDNVATRSTPATVTTPGFAKESYNVEGGMFFGRGTWTMDGTNVMNGNRVQRTPNDTFGYAHSPAQNAVVQEAFGASPHRPNDRLRNAGPTNGWPSALGSTTKVMVFDGDKLHHYHPTRTYQVQVGWYERKWKTCWWGPFPYACSEDIWRTAEKTVWAAERKIKLKATAAYGLTSLVQKVVCAIGIEEIQSGEDSFRICDSTVSEISSAFLPTIIWRLPYQEITVPASQWFTTYYWRFRTDNGAHVSGYTGWSSFYRTL